MIQTYFDANIFRPLEDLEAKRLWLIGVKLDHIVKGDS
jgi:hypothetical protein